MDKKALKTQVWGLAAEGVYRGFLVLFALAAGFSAFPNAKWFIAGLVLLIAGSARALLMNQDLIEQRTQRFSWAEELTVRIALLELYPSDEGRLPMIEA